jgi:hypothetical protein
MRRTWDSQQWTYEDPIRTTVRGGIRRVVASIFLTVGWLSATLLYLAFFASHFTLVQDVVVFFVSMFLLFGTLMAIWVAFGKKALHVWTGW